MKTKLFILLFITITIPAIGQWQLFEQSDFTSLSDVTSDCSGGVNYSNESCGGCPEGRQNAVPASNWFRCGNKFTVSNDGSNYYAEFLTTGSTPIRQFAGGLTTGVPYRISIKVSRPAGTYTTGKNVTLTMKNADDLNLANLSGWSEVASVPNVTVN